ncbi:MAG: biotin transporter BioY [Treponema sp.]
MSNNSSSIGKKTVITALFAALISAGYFINIPLIGGVPVTVQDMMAMLSGLLLGPLYGSAAVLIFLILGSIGLPVFSGKGGINIILNGPTGGFLAGYLFGALIGGLIIYFGLGKCRKRKESSGSENAENAEINKNYSPKKDIYEVLIILSAALAATVIVFALGIIRFHLLLPNKTFREVLLITLVPFIPGNIIKIVIMTILTKKLRPVLLNYIG